LYVDSDEVNDSGYHHDYESVILVRWWVNITLLVYFGHMPHSLYETRREVWANKCVFGGQCDRVVDVDQIL